MDIQKITSELLESGLTQQELANKIPCSQGLINAYANGNRGKRPSMAIGSRLLKLHNQICGKSPARSANGATTQVKPP